MWLPSPTAHCGSRCSALQHCVDFDNRRWRTSRARTHQARRVTASASPDDPARDAPAARPFRSAAEPWGQPTSTVLASAPAPAKQQGGLQGPLLGALAVGLGAAIFAVGRLGGGPSLAALEADSVPLSTALSNGRPTVVRPNLALINQHRHMRLRWHIVCRSQVPAVEMTRSGPADALTLQGLSMCALRGADTSNRSAGGVLCRLVRSLQG